MRKDTGHKIYTGSGCQGGELKDRYGEPERGGVNGSR
jgi:hypothetical protein